MTNVCNRSAFGYRSVSVRGVRLDVARGLAPRTCEGGKASNHQFLKLPRSGTLTFNFQLSTFNFYDYYKKTQFS